MNANKSYPEHDVAFVETLRSTATPCSQQCTCEKCVAPCDEERGKEA